MGWAGFAIAFVAFFVTHSLPVRPPLRPWLQRQLGPVGFTLGYSVLSLGVLSWLIVAAGRAPFVALWPWGVWQNHLALSLMLLACGVFALGVARPNPFSFGGARNHLFDPLHPGLVRLTRHPLLLALALWSTSHLIANGDLAHVLVFGTFAVFAGLGGRLVDRRKRREMGDEWTRLWRATRSVPLLSAGWISVDTVVRLGAGLCLYLALLAAHPYVLGVSPLP